MISIIVQGQEYEVKFGFKANKILTKIWGLKTMGGIGKKLGAELILKPNTEPTMDQLSLIGDLTLSGIKSLNPKVKFDSDDVVDALLNDMEKLPQIFELYVNSQPKIDQNKVKGENGVRGKKKG